MQLSKSYRKWYSNIPNWHIGKLIILWLIDALILISSLLKERENSITEYRPGDYSSSIGGWLILSIPVIVISWKWMGSKEKPEAKRD
jgi:hypothetical protein